jgi:hypothetical protein
MAAARTGMEMTAVVIRRMSTVSFSFIYLLAGISHVRAPAENADYGDL